MRRIAVMALVAAALGLATACDAPQIPIPPTPTPGAQAVSDGHNHQHGEGGPQARLITRYGGPVGVSVATEPEQPEPGQDVTIKYQLKGPDGTPVTSEGLLVTHERYMHLIVVSRDLRYFSHVHPEDAGAGYFTVEDKLPQAGPYVLFNEFYGADGTMQLERDVVTAGGGGKAPATDQSPELTPDLGEPQTVDGLVATVTSNQRKIRRRVPTTFTLNVEKDGKPFVGMEPFLGAPAHVVVVSVDTKQFAHTHGDVPGGAMTGDMSGADMSKMVMPTPPAQFGPAVQFTHTFMQPGMYRVWIQFGHSGGKVTAAAFNVEVLK